MDVWGRRTRVNRVSTASHRSRRPGEGGKQGENERMSETLKLRESEAYKSEYIDESGDYVKFENHKEERWGFYLKFCGRWFYPCKVDQEKLKNLVLNSEHMTIGNKDYLQPIELSMSFDYPDEGNWKEIERRKPTAEELKTLDRYDTPVKKT